MNTSELAKRHCVPCEGGTPPMPREQANEYMEKIPGWNLVDSHIEKEFKFDKYLQGLEFAYALGKTAEEEDHHPDMLIRWGKVKVTLMTHAIKGLSDNDFIMAAKAEEIFRKLIPVPKG